MVRFQRRLQRWVVVRIIAHGRDMKTRAAVVVRGRDGEGGCWWTLRGRTVGVVLVKAQDGRLAFRAARTSARVAFDHALCRKMGLDAVAHR